MISGRRKETKMTLVEKIDVIIDYASQQNSLREALNEVFKRIEFKRLICIAEFCDQTERMFGGHIMRLKICQDCVNDDTIFVQDMIDVYAKMTRQLDLEYKITQDPMVILKTTNFLIKADKAFRKKRWGD